MPKSTPSKSVGKPQKPHPDFPLFAHATKRWAKKIRGKLHYFGAWNDPQGALEKWLDQKDDLLAGRTPRTKGDGLTVKEMVNRFLNHKRGLVDSGELAPRSFARYEINGRLVADVFGRKRLVIDLAADDFAALRSIMAKRWGPVALGNEIQMTRSLFRYAFEAGLIDQPVRFGPGFKKPSAKTLRINRAAGGPKMFTAAEIRKILDNATPNMRAMVLLGINGALGNSDCALLRIEALDLKGAWLDYPRIKTGIVRRIPLWKETIAAIEPLLEGRNKGLLFMGKRGKDYVGGHKGYRVTAEFKRVMEKAGVEGRTFYDLRRTFQTIAEGAHDLVAVQSIMGHAPSSSDMSAVYRQRVDDDRLKAVANHVRRWLFPRTKTK